MIIGPQCLIWKLWNWAAAGRW